MKLKQITRSVALRDIAAAAGLLALGAGVAGVAGVFVAMIVVGALLLLAALVGVL